MTNNKKPSLSRGEFDFLLKMQKIGRSQAYMNKKLIEYRKDTKGETHKDLSNLVAKITAQTDKGEAERERRLQKFYEYDRYKDRIANGETLKDILEREKIRSKAMANVINNPKGFQDGLDFGYIAESDEDYVTSG